MSFDDLLAELNPDPIVQKKKKYQTFTVTTIGGPDEIGKWRAIQSAKAEVFQMRLRARETRIQEAEASLGVKLDAPTIHTTSWAEKQAFAKGEQVRLATEISKVSEWPPWEYIPEPPKPLFSRIKSFLKRLWLSANF